MHNSDINVSELIKKIEADEYKHIDSYVLSNLVKIVHQLGLKKGEVLKLKIKDAVNESGGVVEQINIGKRKMSVSPEVEAIIESQVDHLKSTDNYNVDRNSTLFQDKKGSEYSEAARQLREKFNSPKLEKIRQSGLRKFCDSLKNLNDKDLMDEMKKFTGLSDKEIKGIVNVNIQKSGKKKAIYEKDSYMDEVIDRLQNENDIEFSELLAILDRLNEFDLDDMSKVEQLRDAYFEAVDRNKALNANANGIDEKNKENSKRILKNWFLEKLCNKRIVFDRITNKPRKDAQSEKNREPMSLSEVITGKAPGTGRCETPTNKIPTDLKALEIQDKRKNLKERMDQNFKIEVNILLNNCNLNPVKSYASHLLEILIDQFSIEKSDEKLSDKEKGTIQETFDIIIGDLGRKISFHSTDKPFFKYKDMVHYLAKEVSLYYYTKLDDYEIYQIERDILLKIIGISWHIFTKNERKNFYLGLCDEEHLGRFLFNMVVESHWMNRPFNHSLFEELFGSNSTAFLKIAALIVNSTYFYFFNNDIPIKLDKTHRIWRDSFRDKIIKTIRIGPYSEARMVMSGCISCISLLRQIEFLKDKGITLEDTQAFQVNPTKIFLTC